jgi:hypothetical protein
MNGSKNFFPTRVKVVRRHKKRDHSKDRASRMFLPMRLRMLTWVIRQ